MRRTFIKQALGILLAATVSVSSIPMSVLAEETTPTDTSVSEVSESTDNSENMTIGFTEDQECIDIDTFDWKTASTDEINNAVYAADFVDLGNWLSAMPEDERQELLKKDTYLHNEVQVLSADPSGNGYNEVSGNEDPELWEFSMAQAKMETGEDVSVQTADADDAIAVQSADDAIDAVGAAAICSGEHFGKTTGSYYLIWRVMGADGSWTNYSYKMAVSGISKTKTLNDQYSVNVALVIPSGTPSFLNISSAKGTSTTTAKLQTKVGSGRYTKYQMLHNWFSFTKPAGYSCTFSQERGSSSGIYYYDSGAFTTNPRKFTGTSDTSAEEYYSLEACIHLLDMGVNIVDCDGGVRTQSPGVSGYTFHIAPAQYSVGYQPNGATGGSVPAQTCVYGQTYTPSANAYDRTYSLAYDANGGTSTKVSENVSYDFAGWGWENSGAVTHTTATAFANLTPINGAYAGSFYAIWKPKSTVLPTASRTGYSFLKWYDNSNGATYGGGTAFTPSMSTKLTAQWTPNTYTIKFNSNGGNDLSNLSAAYDSEVALPTPERAGYSFKGWTCNGKTYNGTAKNLTDKDGEVMELTAQWEANTDTPYKVYHMIETTKEEAELWSFLGEEKVYHNVNTDKYYVQREKESLTGTTGEKVTPTAKTYDGFVFDSAESGTIAGNGRTVLRCFYNIEKTETIRYKVEHYLQSREDKTQYILDEANSIESRVEKGTSVTPDVITTYEGYNIPNPQTVTITDDGTVIKYYYTLKDADKSTGNNSGNGNSENGSGNGSGINTGTNTGSHVKESSGSDNAYSDNNNFKSGEVKYYTDAEGNVYKIYINPDGTVTVMNVKSAKSVSSNLSVAGTITVNGFKYQVSEIAPYAFKNNKKIRTVTIGKGITKIGKGAFYGCTKLKTVKGCQTLKEIGSLAFYKCTSLEKMASSKPLETIGSKAFYNCKKLKKYTIGKYTKNIGSEAFRNCKKLKSITIAESVEIIGKKAFYNCKNLKNVNIRTTGLLKVGKAAFKKCKKGLVFKVPEKRAKKYKSLLKGKY